MATLVLTAVGTVVGGPIGAAIGAVIGQQVDAALFAPKARHGPRMGSLAVQTSSYGTAIPKLFGTMRVAGTVVWATDLKESRSASGGGKGGPRTVNYSYSASFAVALSARPIRAVRRIWADGKLLRGAAGDFKVATGFRLYLGGEDQPVDPLIASAESEGTPAFRGIAYALFENLALAEFGNRIPSLTFEVEADAGPVAIGAVARELSGGEVIGGVTPVVSGYAAGGDGVRGAIQALSDVAPLSLVEAGGVLRLTVPDGIVSLVETGEAGAGEERTQILRRAAGSVPEAVSIAYYDPALDYQAGLQRAVRGEGNAARADAIQLAAAISAEDAKGFAARRLAALQAGRIGARMSLPWRRSDLRPGSRVRIEGQAGLWKVARFTLGRGTVALELVRLPGSGPVAAEVASSGRPVQQPDRPHGATHLVLLDIPLGAGDRPQVMAAAAGGEGWRRAGLMTSLDGGESWEAAGESAVPAVIGIVAEALPAGGSALFDGQHAIEVELLNEEMWLESRSDAALAAGANLAAIGEELIQFGRAEALGERRFRLSRLLRGRRGTEWAAGGHAAGEAFVLIEAASLQAIDLPLATLGQSLRVAASGIGDAVPAEAELVLRGEAVRPPAPVHLRGERRANGDLLFTWVRRSRAGWSWTDGTDAPLGEEREAYRIVLSWSGGGRVVESGVAGLAYAAAEQAADGATGPVTAAIVQIGTIAPSRPASITID